MATIARMRRCGNYLALVSCMTVLSVAAAGCAQLSGSNINQFQPLEETVAIATADPLVLSEAAYAPDDIAAPPAQGSASASPASSVIAVPPAGGASNPVVEPNPVSPQSPTLTAPPVVAIQDDGYPNVNIPPAEPTRQLLTPDERAKLIADLNALGKRHGAQ